MQAIEFKQKSQKIQVIKENIAMIALAYIWSHMSPALA